MHACMSLCQSQYCVYACTSVTYLCQSQQCVHACMSLCYLSLCHSQQCVHACMSLCCLSLCVSHSTVCMHAHLCVTILCECMDDPVLTVSVPVFFHVCVLLDKYLYVNLCTSRLCFVCAACLCVGLCSW